jgi:hypothetical protein
VPIVRVEFVAHREIGAPISEHAMWWSPAPAIARSIMPPSSSQARFVKAQA